MTTAVARGVAHVVGATEAHPPTVLSNDDLERSVPGLKPGWIDQHLGIAQRRVLQPNERAIDLAAAALDRALREAGWRDVDALVCATSFVDDLLPASASSIVREHCPGALAFDVNAACASVPYALAVGESLIERGMADRVGVAVVEHPSAWADYDDPTSCVYWGDAAGVLLLQREVPEHGFAIEAVSLANDNAFPERVRVPRHGTFSHDGRYSYAQVCRLTAVVSEAVLGEVGAAAGELAAFVGHQSNTQLLTELGVQLGIAWDRQWHNVEWAGNQGAAGVLTAFADGWRRHRDELAPGDRVLLAAVGGGYAAGAVLLRHVGG